MAIPTGTHRNRPPGSAAQGLDPFGSAVAVSPWIFALCENLPVPRQCRLYDHGRGNRMQFAVNGVSSWNILTFSTHAATFCSGTRLLVRWDSHREASSVGSREQEWKTSIGCFRKPGRFRSRPCAERGSSRSAGPSTGSARAASGGCCEEPALGSSPVLAGPRISSSWATHPAGLRSSRFC